jgi:hypothetical protein
VSKPPVELGRWIETPGSCSLCASGPWGAGATGYLGVRFSISGQNHYGWISLTEGPNFGLNGGGYSGSILGYAYESCANVGITAGATSGGGTCGATTPEPGTLGLVALGSLGLGFWRRKKTVGGSR